MSTFFHNSTSSWDKTLEKVPLKKKLSVLKKVLLIIVEVRLTNEYQISKLDEK